MRRVATMAVALTFFAVACKGSAEPAASQRPDIGGRLPTLQQTPPVGVNSPAAGGSEQGGGTASGTGGDSGQSGAQNASAADMRTFAYGTVDVATLTADTAEMSATASQLAADAASLNASAATNDAKTLEKQAKALETDASDSTDRMRPLSPPDGTLKKARNDALDVCSLAESYASTAVDTADALAAGSLQELRKAAAQIDDLVGTSEQLASAYADTTKELEQWAGDNPATATAALAKYGNS